MEAAWRAGDVTVDFTKMGSVMQTVNTVVPFSNASLQGGLNIIRTVRDHPVRSAAIGSVFLAPTYVTRVHNMAFETSDMIPDYEYTRGWPIMIMDLTRKDGTKYPFFFTMPKGEIAAIATFALEAVFSWGRENEDRGLAQLVLEAGVDAARNTSPVDTGGRANQRGGLGSPGDIAGSFITGLIPPAGQTGVAITSGIDPFTNAPIIPRSEQTDNPEQQFGHDTSSLAIAVAQKLRWSPRMLQFAIEDSLAGTGRSSNWLLGQALDAAGFDRPEVFGEQTDNQRPEGPEALSLTPAGRFLRTSDSQLERRGWEKLNDATESTKRAFNEVEGLRGLGLELGQVGDSIRVLPMGGSSSIELTPAQRAVYQQALGDTLTPAIAAFVADLPESLNPDQRKARIASEMTRLRADAINTAIDRIDWSDTPESKALLADRETLRPYWDMSNDYAAQFSDVPKEQKALWSAYRNASGEDRKALRAEDPDLIKKLERQLNRDRDAWLLGTLDGVSWEVALEREKKAIRYGIRTVALTEKGQVFLDLWLATQSARSGN